MFKIHYAAMALTALFSLTTQADEESEITPYRPTVSNTAQLPTPGQLEFEFGGLESTTGATRRTSLPYLLKLAFNEEWGVLIGGDAYVRNVNNGVVDNGIGDTTVTLKRAIIINETTAFGLEFGVKSPTAKVPIGTGMADYGINGIFSYDFDQMDSDTNLNVTHIGTGDAAQGTVQIGVSSSFSFPVTDRWGVSVELSGTHRNLVPDTAQFLVAATYSPSKIMTLDIGIIRGLNAASPNWAIFSGIVIPVTKLW